MLSVPLSIYLCKHDLVQSLRIHIFPFEKWKYPLIQIWLFSNPDTRHILRMSKAPYDAMFASVSLHRCSQWESPGGVKCLIQDTFPDFFNMLRLGTRWSRAFCLWLQTWTAAVLLHYSVVDLFVCCTQGERASFLCCRAPRFILKLSSPVTDISSVDAVFISLAPASSFHHIPPSMEVTEGIFFLRLRWGSWHEGVFFPRLPIRTILNPIVKNVTFLFCFLLSLSRTDHIDQSWKLQTEETDEWVQCFPLCSVTTH